MRITNLGALCGKSYVDLLERELLLQSFCFQLLLRFSELAFDSFTHFVHHLTNLRTIFRCNILHGIKKSLQFTLLTKKCNSDIVQAIQISCFFDLCFCFCTDLVKFFLHHDVLLFVLGVLPAMI